MNLEFKKKLILIYLSFFAGISLLFLVNGIFLKNAFALPTEGQKCDIEKPNDADCIKVSRDAYNNFVNNNVPIKGYKCKANLCENIADADQELICCKPVSKENQNTEKNQNTAGVENGLTNPLGKITDIPTLVGAVIRAVLGLLGVICLCFIIYGGFLFLTSGGSEEQIKKAKGTISWAIVGTVIIFGAYAITYFVIEALFGKS